jgi:Pro-kumamolisin, activation domain
MTPHISHNYSPLPGSEHPKVKGARRTKPADPDETVRVLIRVRRPPGSAPAPDYDHWVRTSPSKRKYLSRKELGEKYGASPADLEHVAQFARSKELHVQEKHAARRLVIITGTVKQFNHAFAVDLGHYEVDDDDDYPTYRGHEGSIHAPQDVHHLIEAVFGLDDRRVLRRFQSGPADLSNNGPNNSPLTPIDIANLYNFPPIPANMSDQTIGLLELSGGLVISSNGRPTDVDLFVNSVNTSYTPPLNLANVNVTPVVLTGGSSAFIGPNKPNQPNPGAPNTSDLEVAADVDIVGTVANGSPIALYYIPGNYTGYLEALLAILFPENGQPEPSVLSISWYFGDEVGFSPISSLQTMSAIFQQAAEAGITVLTASGDWGTNGAGNANDGSVHVLYPFSDPWVTVVGGTQISNINWTDSTTASTFQEITWNTGTAPNTQTSGVTGGGISTVKDSSGNLVFPLPSWQQGFPIPASKLDASRGRGYPDIAGFAQGYNFFLYQSALGAGGTSTSAPLYAALIARINATLGYNVGYLNPSLYAFATTSPTIFKDTTNIGIPPVLSNNAFTWRVVNSTGQVTSTGISPGYPTGVGWDACTGLGSVNGTNLLQAFSVNTISPAFFFSVSKNTFGAQEVSQTKQWTKTFSLVLDGFSLSQLGGLPDFKGTFKTSIPFIDISPSTTTTGWPATELGGSDNSLQRITFLYDINFPANIDPSTYFPGVGTTSTLTLEATLSLTAPGTPLVKASAQFELVAGADPFFLNVDQTVQNPWWLSQDLRVLTVCPQIHSAPVQGKGNYPTWEQTSSNLYDTGAAYKYIQALIKYLNINFSDPTSTDPFTSPTLLPLAGGLTGDSSVTPYTIDPSTGVHNSNYNFAIARVRLIGGGGSGASVSTFFRLFLTASNDTDYQRFTTYATTQVDLNEPLAPAIGDVADPVTIPFFASGNYESNADFDMQTDYTNVGANAQLIQIPQSATGVWAYFGCYLNVYNAQYTIGGHPLVLTGAHHCLVAEISYSGTPIPQGTPVANTSQLAQRNLQITPPSDNPGPPAAHRVPLTFDMRPSPAFDLAAASALVNWPDEIVIDWGNVPAGATASVYWPAVASKLYATHNLVARDPHTLDIRNVGGGKTSYIPVPASTTAQNFAGLLTVELPLGVVAGQEFGAVVSRWTTKQAAPPATHIFSASATHSSEIENWRVATGSFAVSIPVSTPAAMLGPERDLLAIFRWRLSQLPSTSRWYPVLKKYVGYIEGRIVGLGGNPITVVPSPNGSPPSSGPMLPGGPPLGGGSGGHGGHGGHHGGHHGGPHAGGHHGGHHRHEKHTGKVEGLVYDRFGDFDGFVFRAEDGSEHRYRSRSEGIEELVQRAWRQRMVVEVHGQHGDPFELAQVILKEWPMREL